MTGAHHRPLRFLMFAAVAACGALGAPPAFASDPAAEAKTAIAAQAVIRSMWDRVRPILANKGMDKASREAQFGVIYRATFDNAAIAAAVTGPAWHRATPEQRQQFLKLFETYVIKVYAGQFATYNGERLLVVRSEPDGDGAIVTSQIVGPDSGAQRQIELRWRLRMAGDALKVRDVIVENISMTLNQHREFRSVMQQRGGTIEGLIAALREKIAELDRKN